KPLAALLILKVFGYEWQHSLAVSVALAQIGEFSLILATVADQLGIFPANTTNALIAAALVSISLNPILYRLVGQLKTLPTAGPPQDRIVIVGYGPIGRTVARLLRDGGIEPVVVEANPHTITHAINDGYRAVCGDATQSNVL